MTADQQGRATFPTRMLTASVMRRLTLTMLSALAGVHASFGPHANVFA
jgi:hypothetical protein